MKTTTILRELAEHLRTLSQNLSDRAYVARITDDIGEDAWLCGGVYAYEQAARILSVRASLLEEAELRTIDTHAEETKPHAA